MGTRAKGIERRRRYDAARRPAIGSVNTRQLEHEVRGAAAVAVTFDVRGQPTVEPLTVALQELDGVHEVNATDPAQPVD